MHPDIEILSCSSNGNTWSVHFNEKNDFAKLIGFPGWKGMSQLTFNSKKLITESIYLPDSTNRSYRPYLRPALDWLRQNMPAQLDEVYKDNKLSQRECRKMDLLVGYLERKNEMNFAWNAHGKKLTSDQ